MSKFDGTSESRFDEPAALKVLNILRDYNRPLARDFVARIASQDAESIARILTVLKVADLVAENEEGVFARPKQK